MTDSYPFVGVVKDRESGHYISLLTLEERGAQRELIYAIVHGPITLATEMMAQWNNDYLVEANESLTNE